MHYLVSFLVFNHLDEEERVGCIALIVFLVLCCCYCSVALPHGAMGLSAICDCVISLIISTYFLNGYKGNSVMYLKLLYNRLDRLAQHQSSPFSTEIQQEHVKILFFKMTCIFIKRIGTEKYEFI